MYPGSQILILSIPDPGSNNNKRGRKNCCLAFFCNHNFTQLKIILYFQCKFFFLQIDKNMVPFTQKIVTKLPEKRVAVPGYEIRYPEKTYPDPRKDLSVIGIGNPSG